VIFKELLSGRASRREFWIVSALMLVVEVAMLAGGVSELLIEAILLWPWFWITWRRLHDINISGWWSLVPFGLNFLKGFLDGFSKGVRQTHSLAAPDQNELTNFDWSLALAHPLEFATGFAQGFLGAQWSQLQQHPLSVGVGWAVVLLLALWPGTPGANRYGERRRTAPPIT
jgi:uncharacterized membrane protein YhaH (DUF805 family)